MLHQFLNKHTYVHAYIHTWVHQYTILLIFVETQLLSVCNSVPELRTLDLWNFIFPVISTSKDISVDIIERQKGDSLLYQYMRKHNPWLYLNNIWVVTRFSHVNMIGSLVFKYKERHNTSIGIISILWLCTHSRTLNKIRPLINRLLYCPGGDGTK